MKIHLLERDPKVREKDFLETMGPFSLIHYNLNESLKALDAYAEPDDADWVGVAGALDVGFAYKDKKSFNISVWEMTNTLSVYHVQEQRLRQQKVIGMSNQITNLWRKYNILCETLYCGCDTDFYKPTSNRSEVFTFLHINSSSVRSWLDLTLRAFHKAFQNNKDVRLIVKDVNSNTEQLERRIAELNDKGSNIIYRGDKWKYSQIRNLYSESHVCLNLIRTTSFGFPLLESSACGCLCVAGDVEPTNELIRPEYGVLIKPSGEIKIREKLSELVNEWGLKNWYPNFQYFEEPLFYDFDIDEYADKLIDIYNNWNFYKTIDTRTPMVYNWKWSDSAKKLIKILQN